MMVFLPCEVMEELTDDTDDPSAEVARFLKSELNLPVAAGKHGVHATRGRLDFKVMPSGEVRVMHHEIH